jgi:DNA-directed RNA polymerase specialized sigma24 family protein
LPDEPQPTTPETDPAVHLEETETDALVGRVLERAWSSLTDRELEVVVLKYRHQLPQKQIARALRVSPSRVTRLLQSATRRLRVAVEARFELRAHVTNAESNQAALLQLLERMLSRSDAGRAGDDQHGRGTA